MSVFQKNVQTYYEITYEEKKNGKKKRTYRYCGPWYHWLVSEEALHRIRRQTAGLLGLNAALFLIAALHRGGINAVSAVIIPCMISVIALIYQAFGVWIFLSNGETITEPDLKDYHMAVLTGSGCHAVLMLVTFFAGVWSMLTGGLTVHGWWPLLLYGICGLLSLKVCVLHGRLKEEILTDKE